MNGLALPRRVLLPLIFLVAFPPVILYLFASQDLLPASLSAYAPSSPFRTSPSFSNDDYVPDVPDIWQYLEEKRPRARRASWGGLKQQGARRHLRENLIDEKHYVLAGIGGGWNNNVMAVFHIIHLALLSQRIPILPPFNGKAYHLGTDPNDVAISEIFDTSYLSAVLAGLPIVETWELKLGAGTPHRLRQVMCDGEHEQRGIEVGEWIGAEEPGEDELGCWSFFGTQGLAGYPGLGNHSFSLLDLDFTPLPPSVYPSSDLWRPSLPLIASLIQPNTLDASAPIPPASLDILKTHHMPISDLPPEDHLACLDTAYYAYDAPQRWHDVLDEYREGMGAWNTVGRHMRFQPGWIALREGYLRKAFGVGKREEIPPYLALHIRRTDFTKEWKALTPRDYAHAATDVLRSIHLGKGIAIKHVLVATDETDPAWLSGLHDYGFHVVNHTALQTVERFGAWLPTLLDAVLLSGGTGFLGVSSSTMSLLAYRRTIDWNDGIGGLIQLDHQVPDEWEWSWDPAAW